MSQQTVFVLIGEGSIIPPRRGLINDPKAEPMAIEVRSMNVSGT